MEIFRKLYHLRFLGALLPIGLAIAGCHEEKTAAQLDLRPDCLAVPASPPAKSAKNADALAAWQTFREVHPYPYQAFAGEKLPNGRAALIISEPPPDIDQKAAVDFVQELFADRHPHVDIRRTMIASDGYVEDLVVALDAPSLKTDDLLSDADLRDRIGILHSAWYGTSCGGDVETIGSRLTSAPKPVSPDLQISPGELGAWLADSAVTWSEIESDTPTFAAFDALSQGAFRSSDGSLVLFTVPLATLDDPAKLAGLRTAFRRFAVSSDAILGASWTADGKLAIVGRQRTHALSDIPPLRFETFTLIAAQHSAELAQSYERTNPLAGKMRSIDRDWAPIFLSDPLIDTELGALLNVTDQMLKSWSQAGEIHYLHFNYPRTPDHFAFGNQPLSDLVYKKTGSHEVLFNWNTAGLGVAFEQTEPASTIFTARRLGALPVTYGANVDGGEIETGGLGAQEDKAYAYFASLGDPNLARVVQYTLIYQAITAARQAAGSNATNGDNSTDLAPPDKLLVEKMRPILAVIRVKGWHDLISTMGDDELTRQLDHGLQAYAALRTRFSDDQILGALANRNKMQRLFNELPADTPDGNSSGPSFATKALPINQIPERLAQLGQAIGTAVQIGVRLEPVKAAFEQASQRPQKGWIRTPSVVVSWGTGQSAKYVGGHNLDARVVRFQESSSVDGIELSDDGVILYNPSQAQQVSDKAADLARAVEHGGARSTDDLSGILAGAARPARTRLAALEMETPGAARPVARLGSRTFDTNGTFVESLRRVKQDLKCCRVLGRDDAGHAVLVETNAVPPPTLRTIEFGDNVSLGDYLRKNKQPDVIMFDQPSDHVKALLLSAVEPRGTGSPFQMINQRIRGMFRTAPGRGDHVIGLDLNGRPSSIMIHSEGRLSSSERLARLNEAQALRVNELRLQMIGPEDMQSMLHNLDWNPAIDGLPKGVRVSFATKGKPRGFFDVIIGRRRPDAQAELRVQKTIQSSLASAKPDSSLLHLQMTIKNDLRAMNDADLSRIAFFVQQDRGTMQMTLLLSAERPQRG